MSSGPSGALDWVSVSRVAFVLLCIGLFIGAPVWILLHPGMVVGWAGDTTEVSGSVNLLQVENSWGPPEYILASDSSVRGMKKGQLLLAYGQAVNVQQWPVLQSELISVSPIKLNMMWRDPWVFLQNVFSPVLRSTGAALGIGIALLLLGYLFIRLLAAVVGGLLGLVFGWWAAGSIAMLAGFSLPVEGVIVAHAVGCLLGIWLGFRRRGWSGYLFQRLSIGLLVFLFAEGIARQFEWSVNVTSIIALFGSLISPAAGLGLLSAFLTAAGIGVVGWAAVPVLAATGVSIHLMRDGSWLPLTRMPRGRRRGDGTHGEIPLERIVS